MRKRLACQGLLTVASLLLCSCSLLQAPLHILGGLLGLGTRVLNLGADNNHPRPFRLETGEIERSRAMSPLESVTPAARPSGNVVVR